LSDNFGNKTLPKETPPFEDIDKNDELDSILIETLPPLENGFLRYRTNSNYNNVQAPYSYETGSINIRLEFSPARNWFGTTSFTYRAFDGTDWSADSATVWINIAPVNDPPIAQNDTFYISEDAVPTVLNVLTNDKDIDDIKDSLKISIVDGGTAGANGTINLLTNRNFTYTPNLNFNGTVSFTYSLCDTSNACATAIVTIVIHPENDPPSAVDDNYTITEDYISYNFNPTTNDTDIDGDTTAVSSVEGDWIYGTITWNPDGNFDYTLNPKIDTLKWNEKVTEIFSYVVADSSGTTDTAIDTITIQGVNDPPSTHPANYNTEEGVDSIYTPDEKNILSFCSDPDGDPLTVVNINTSDDYYGELKWKNDGSFVFIQNLVKTDSLKQDKTLTVSYPYTVSDGIATSDSLIYINIKGVNDPPHAVNDTLIIYEYDLFKKVDNLAPEAMLYPNDTDPDYDPIRIFKVQDTTAAWVESTVGELEWQSDGSYSYTPKQDTISKLSGTDIIFDKFSYVLYDELATDTAFLVIKIIGVNNSPVANNDTLWIDEDTHYTEIADSLGLLSNDTDPDRDYILVEINGQNTDVGELKGNYGTLRWDSLGAFNYTTDIVIVDTLFKGEQVTDVFNYVISDPDSSVSWANLIVVITGQNDAPVAVNHFETIDENDPPLERNTRSEGILQDCSDVDDHLEFYIVSVNNFSDTMTTGTYGNLDWQPDGTFTYTLNRDNDSLYNSEVVIDSFLYTIEDPFDSTAQAYLIIKITGENNAPVAKNDTIKVKEDILSQEFNKPEESLLINDSDTDGDKKWVISMNNLQTDSIPSVYCSVKWDSTGAFTYYRNPGLDTLAIGAELLDSISYTITDINDSTASAWLFIRIIGENDAPVAKRDNNHLLETTDSIASDSTNYLLVNDSDTDIGDSIYVIKVKGKTALQTKGKFGELAWDGEGNYIYYNDSLATDTLYQDEVVYDIFPYTISDREKATATDSLWIKITGVNDKPIAFNDTLSLEEDDLSGSLTANTDGLLHNDIDVDGDILLVTNFSDSIKKTFDTQYGTITWDSFGNIDFTINQNAVNPLKKDEVVSEIFQYVAEDPFKSRDTAQLIISITGDNDNPEAHDEQISITEDTLSVSGFVADSTSLLSNDTDIDRDSIFVALVNGSPDNIAKKINGYGELHWDSTGAYTYYTYREITDTLAFGERVTEEFVYTISDTTGGTGKASLFIEIIGVNDAPVALSNTYLTLDVNPIIVAVIDTTHILYNDYDVDGHKRTLTEVNGDSINTTTKGDFGILNWKNDGSFKYQPDSIIAESLRPKKQVIDTFTYKVKDEFLASDDTLLYYIIEGINNAPTARDTLLFVFESDTLIKLITPGLLANATDPDKDTLQVLMIEGSIDSMVHRDYGDLYWDKNGEVQFRPIHTLVEELGPNQKATESYTFTIIDEGGLKDTASFFVYIIGKNSPITAFDDTLIIDEDSYGRINVVQNDSDLDYSKVGNFDYSSLTILEGPSSGNAFVNSSNGIISYFPDENYNGKDSLKYKICDTGGLPGVYCDEAWLYINVLSVNDPPVATPLVLETPMNTPVGFNYFNQVTDVDDGIDSTSLKLPDNNNKVKQNGDSIIYTPENSFTGIDEFIYSMNDSTGASAYVIVTVIVGDSLSGFHAQNDTITTPEDTPADIDILANDTLGGDFPDPRSVDIKVPPINGTAVFDPAKLVIHYSPRQDFNGTDCLTYIVSSGTGNWSFAKVIITVTPVNDQMIANDDLAETLMETPVTIPVLGNDYDPDHRIDTIYISSPAENGVASVKNQNGLMNYTPGKDFKGIDSLIYTICDSNTVTPGCDNAIVRIIVKSKYSRFIAMNDNYSTDENKPLNLVNPTPLSNDNNDEIIPTDPESFAILSGPLHGSYSINNGIVTYTPEENYFGPDWMEYIVSDTAGNWDKAEINIWVNEVNIPPVAVNDTAIVIKNEFKRLRVLDNDYDIDGTLNWSTLDIVSGFGPQNGEVQIDRNTGTILYKPSINKGDDHFTYRICDNKGQCSTATVYITIGLETTIYIWKSTNEDTPVTIDIASRMADYNLTFTIADIIKEIDPDLGTYSFANGNSDLIYSPSKDVIGKDTIKFNVWSADHTEFAYLRIFITIIPVNDAPVALDDTIHWINSPDAKIITFDSLLVNDYDVDGDQILLTDSVIQTGYDELHVVFNADSTITITADTILWCDAWFTYEIMDGDGLKDTAKVTIWPKLIGVTAVDDSAKVNENSLANIIDVLANDSFVGNQRCTIDSVIIITPPKNGTAVSTSDDFIDYTSTRHYYGPDSLQYKITDRWGQTDTAWVLIHVVEKNSPPVAVNDETFSIFGTVVNIPVLNNDYDPDAISYPDSPGDPNAFIDSSRTHLAIGSYPLYGTVIFDPATYNFIYTPDVTTCDIDSFQYTIYDNENDSCTATVKLTMSEAPIFAFPDIVMTYPGITKEVEPLLNDSGYFVADYTSYSIPSSIHGNVTWNSQNVVSYTSDKGFIGRDSVLYTIFSPCGNEQSAWIVFVVEELRVPEIISPNGDGKNDVLIIDGIEYFPDNLFQIFNRYGHIVYQKKGYMNEWGGYSNKGSLGGNKPLPAGTYYYTLIYNEGRNRQAGFIYIFW
jgi:gliding motility-associated-like protein